MANSNKKERAYHIGVIIAQDQILKLLLNPRKATGTMANLWHSKTNMSP